MRKLYEVNVWSQRGALVDSGEVRANSDEHAARKARRQFARPYCETVMVSPITGERIVA